MDIKVTEDNFNLIKEKYLEVESEKLFKEFIKEKKAKSNIIYFS